MSPVAAPLPASITALTTAPVFIGYMLLWSQELELIIQNCGTMVGSAPPPSPLDDEACQLKKDMLKIVCRENWSAMLREYMYVPAVLGTSRVKTKGDPTR
ncbi:hypothetical protein JMJ77_0010990, partial [Colletotrichum scovillei]